MSTVKLILLPCVSVNPNCVGVGAFVLVLWYVLRTTICILYCMYSEDILGNGECLVWSLKGVFQGSDFRVLGSGSERCVLEQQRGGAATLFFINICWCIGVMVRYHY